MTDTKRTPGPWTYEGTGSFIGGPDQQRVADVFRDNLPAEERRANAAFIVKACNSHDDLVEALKSIIDEFASDKADQGMCADPYTLGRINRARNALAGAEGEAK